ncbi:MAG: hypothetical protein Q7K45_03020 [Nanoarchaeota archaeon]|nr:hypothetical protein [Nanoarchaeota archaeon]
MVPDEKTIVRASYEAAIYDAIIDVPDQNTLRFVTGAGLHRFLPKWINLETGTVDRGKLEQRALKMVVSDYVAPLQFREKYAQELKINLPKSVHDLNYMLVTEIISISPEGKVNPLIYKLSTARVTKQASMEVVRKIYDQGLEAISNPQFRKYLTFVQEQILQTQQRFVDELPMLEKVLQEEGLPSDLSTLDVAIFGRIGDDGKPIVAHPFL